MVDPFQPEVRRERITQAGSLVLLIGFLCALFFLWVRADVSDGRDVKAVVLRLGTYPDPLGTGARRYLLFSSPMVRSTKCAHPGHPLMVVRPVARSRFCNAEQLCKSACVVVGSHAELTSAFHPNRPSAFDPKRTFGSGPQLDLPSPTDSFDASSLSTPNIANPSTNIAGTT
jgi:hypothetical protein